MQMQIHMAAVMVMDMTQMVGALAATVLDQGSAMSTRNMLHHVNLYVEPNLVFIEWSPM